jgi:hypothetical protein
VQHVRGKTIRRAHEVGYRLRPVKSEIHDLAVQSGGTCTDFDPV